MATVTQLVTAQEFMTMDLGEGIFELVRGEVVELPQPRPQHGLTCGNGAYLLGRYGRESGLGYVLSNDSAVRTDRDPDTVRGADLAFYTHAKWPRDRVGNGLIPVAADLVVEVASPGNRPADMLEKVSEYLRAGIANVWVIYPAKRLLIAFRPDADDPTIHTEFDPVENVPELPGFRCVVADFFA